MSRTNRNLAGTMAGLGSARCALRPTELPRITLMDFRAFANERLTVAPAGRRQLATREVLTNV